MLNPLSLPADVLAALRSVASIELQLQRLPDELEKTLRPHLDAQNEGIATLHPELVANREHAEKLPGRVDALTDEVRALRGELRAVLGEISEVRETVEPLQGPAQRVARLCDRLPGDG